MVACETKAEAFAAISEFRHAGLEIIRVACPKENSLLTAIALGASSAAEAGT